MKKIIVLIIVSACLAGCEEFPVEGVGGDDFAAAKHRQARASRTHGGMDDHLLRVAEDR